MKLVFISPHLHPGSGGPKVIYRLCQNLKALGHDTSLFVHKLSSNTHFWLNDGNQTFPIFELEKNNRNISTDADCIINFTDGKPFAPFPANIPQILFLQGFGTQQYEKECANLLYPYRGVICTSKWLADLAIRCNQKNVYIVPPGIDHIFKNLNIRKNYPIIGTLYHNAIEKNTALAITGMHKFFLTYRKIPYNALFLSSRMPNNLDMLSEFPINYSFIVNPPQALLPIIYSSCTLWISPSINEGFGLTTLEAMACGCPTIVYPNLGLDEYLVHGENCFICDDKMKIVSAINVLLSDNTTINNIANKGLSLANKFTWKNSCNNFIQAIKDILK